MLLQLNSPVNALGLLAFFLAVTIPGYLWTLAFFPEKKSVGRIERAVLSVLFSITFLPMLVLLENTLFGVPLEFFSVFSTLLALAIISVLIYLIRTQRLNAPEFVYGFLPKVEKEESVGIIPKIF